jgi:hypothetical protein
MMPVIAQREPTDNLRDYVSKAILPPMDMFTRGERATPRMPRPGHSSHRNLLHFRGDPGVLLAVNYKMKTTEFFKKVTKCM